MIALVAGIGGFVLAADDHGQVGAYYYQRSAMREASEESAL